jgi:hypothetical protein
MHADGKRMPEPRWCPSGITKIQRHRLQKLRQCELVEKQEEVERDRWFNQLRPMTRPRQTWREKRLAREENSTDSNDSHDEFKTGESSGTKVDVESTAHPTLDNNMCS